MTTQKTYTMEAIRYLNMLEESPAAEKLVRRIWKLLIMSHALFKK